MTKNFIESLDNFALNFDKLKDNHSFMKEQLYEFKEEDKIYINFRECHIAICPNGGLIAICKKKGYLDVTKGSKINDYIIVMHQTARKKYYIHIDWKYKQKYFILFDFNEKEQLYGICNDGSIYKIDILTEKAVPKVTSQFFQTENITKAKLYEEGFIALTARGDFYYVKDIKNPTPELLFQMRSHLKFSNNINFLIIPESVSKSHKIELLITNEKGNGVIHIEKMEDARYYIMPLNDNSEILAYRGISILQKDRLEPFILQQSSSEKKNQEKKYDLENLKKIAAFAISPSKKRIALYDTRGLIFFFNSTLDLDIDKNPRIKAQIKISEELSSNEIIEQQMVMNYDEGFQFLFCGEDSVILAGLRLILLVHKSDQTITYKIIDTNENDALKGKLFCRCISEIDGIRFITNDGIFFISPICKELFDICDTFSNSYARALILAFQNHLDKSGNTEKLLRENYNLAKAINSLQLAAGSIFWMGEPPEGNNYEKKEIQLFILKAAQYGKIFVNKDEFNYDKFLEICKDIRCVNNLRNHSQMPKLITFFEYKNLDSKDLIKKLMRSLNFGIAFEICHFLDYSDKRVYQRYAIAKIKKSSTKYDREEEKEIFNRLNEKLKNVPNLSFVKLAKKAFKYHKNIIGMKFLENEKSALSKIPQYIELKEWDKALDFAENFYDYNIINTVLYKIFKKEKISDFINIIGLHPKAKPSVIQFLKKNDYEQIENYLKINKNPEELFFFYLEEYFQTFNISEKKKYISLLKENMKLIDNNINPNFEHKFYKSYIESLENDLIFKLDPNNNFISNPEETAFDISIYDFYKLGIKEINNEKNNYIEKYNKIIGFPQEGMNILKLLTLGEDKKFSEMDDYIKKYNNNVKKMGLTYLNVAEIYYKFKNYKKAVEYIKGINEPIYSDYKIEMLEYINDLESALEVIISDKTIGNMAQLVERIIKKKPELQKKADELCLKYKVILNK